MPSRCVSTAGHTSHVLLARLNLWLRRFSYLCTYPFLGSCCLDVSWYTNRLQDEKQVVFSEEVVDRARFELAASWMQTMRSAGLIYRPTVVEESYGECFNPYALNSLHALYQPRMELLSVWKLLR